MAAATLPIAKVDRPERHQTVSVQALFIEIYEAPHPCQSQGLQGIVFPGDQAQFVFYPVARNGAQVHAEH